MYYGKVTSIELLLDYSYTIDYLYLIYGYTIFNLWLYWPASIGKQNFTLRLLIQKERNFPQIV